MKRGHFLIALSLLPSQAPLLIPLSSPLDFTFSQNRTHVGLEGEEEDGPRIGVTPQPIYWTNQCLSEFTKIELAAKSENQSCILHSFFKGGGEGEWGGLATWCMSELRFIKISTKQNLSKIRDCFPSVFCDRYFDRSKGLTERGPQQLRGDRPERREGTVGSIFATSPRSASVSLQCG